MTSAELELRGQLLYGRQWQGDLSRNLGVCRDTVTKWKSGHRNIKPEFERKIEELLAKRVVMIQSLISCETKKENKKFGKVCTFAA